MLHTIQDLTTKVAELTRAELAQRGISVKSATKELTREDVVNQPTIYYDNNGKVYAVHVTTSFTSAARIGNAKQFEEYAQKIALELSLKLARGNNIVSYVSEMPRGVDEAASITHRNLWLRGLSDYLVQTDELVTKFTAFVEWA